MPSDKNNAAADGTSFQTRPRAMRECLRDEPRLGGIALRFAAPLDTAEGYDPVFPFVALCRCRPESGDLQIGSARAKPVYISPQNQRDSECSVPELRMATKQSSIFITVWVTPT